MNLNNFFKEKLLRLGAEDNSSLEPFVKRAVYLSSLNINSDIELQRYIVLNNHAKNMNIKLTNDQKKNIIKKSSSEEDILYLLVKEGISSRGIKKVAYPNPGMNADSLYDEVDINAWLDIVRKIYKACKSGRMTKAQAAEFYSNTLDKEEKRKFLRWVWHFLSEENLKYSSNKGDKMKKESVFLAGLNDGGPYAHDGGSYYLQNGNSGNNMPGDSFSGTTSRDSVKLDSGSSARDGAMGRRRTPSSERRLRLKKGLNAACRRIDKLIREEDFVSHEEYMTIAKLLLELSSNINKVKVASTAEDLTLNTASKIKKLGHTKYADNLVRLAQEVIQDDAAQPPEAPAVAEEPPPQGAGGPEGAVGQEQGQGDGVSDQERESGVSVPEPDAVEPTKLRDISPIPGPYKGEYEALAGNIKLEDAAAKLDEVAGMLADRRIIRHLAEFDIMLDKIGIASMFPELAESQSKLIDSFSYALTRVTKMMGQLSNAKSLLESGGMRPLPGSEQEADSVPAEEPIEQSPEEPVEPQAI